MEKGVLDYVNIWDWFVISVKREDLGCVVLGGRRVFIRDFMFIFL